MTSATSCDSMYDLFNPVNNEKKENNMSPNEQKSSQTALFSALRRAIANEIYSAHYVELLLMKSIKTASMPPMILQKFSYLNIIDESTAKRVCSV